MDIQKYKKKKKISRMPTLYGAIFTLIRYQCDLYLVNTV